MPMAGWQAHNPQPQQQQYFLQQIQQPPPPSFPQQQQQQQYQTQHPLPPPSPQPLSNRAHTPSRENTHETLYHMAGSSPVAGITSITLKLWSHGNNPMATPWQRVTW